MKIKNRTRPKIDLCGTPHLITLGFESTFFIDTYILYLLDMSGTSLKLLPEHHKYFTLIAESRG